LTAAHGRKFGLTVGIAFAVIGALLLWRAKPVKADLAFGLATLLIVAALAIPTRLGPLERAWMALAHLISRVTTPIFMGIVYFIILTPMGIIRRMAGKSVVRVAKGEHSLWAGHPPADPARMERQF
jgi:hypothetical protein